MERKLRTLTDVHPPGTAVLHIKGKYLQISISLY